mmetsp:Transcript_79146/g.144362  ORF Transcript_79146/g.144362 Transcript_79146/m.144362 type:complete len:130 (+) Transcript_79146:54-443(+)
MALELSPAPPPAPQPPPLCCPELEAVGQGWQEQLLLRTVRHNRQAQVHQLMILALGRVEVAAAAQLAPPVVDITEHRAHRVPMRIVHLQRALVHTVLFQKEAPRAFHLLHRSETAGARPQSMLLWMRLI